MNNKRFFAAVALTAFAGVAFANVKPASVFTSNMVLPRDCIVPVWGTAVAGEKVKVSFSGQVVFAVADGNGDWEARLQPLKASKRNRVLTIEGANLIELKDVLVGDVWLCSGQSNMEMSFDWDIYDGDAFKKEAAEKYDQIRCFKVLKAMWNWPRPNAVVEHPWARTSSNMSKWTAVGYFFARKLVQELDVPIGLINASWSGSKIEPFLAPCGIRACSPKTPEVVKFKKEFLEQFERCDLTSEAGKKAFRNYLGCLRSHVADVEAALAAGKTPQLSAPQMPTCGMTACQCNAMIAPLARFPIKGVVWYQGCSNGLEGETYTEKTEMLVRGWRELWGRELPFYWVQLASYFVQPADPKGGTGYALVRDAQRLALKRLPKTGMAVTLDVGNGKDIHPKAKLAVGERLAAWALKNEYGKKVVPSGPLFREAKGLGTATVRISFDYAGAGLVAGKKDNLSNAPVELLPGEKLVGFAAEVEDGSFVWADATIDGNGVVVTAKGKTIKNVRYGYRANATGLANLYNRDGLPASPFATENNW